jgi:hypothetical protein
MSIRARLARFAGQIRPTDKHIEEANRQTTYMIEQLKSRVSEDGSIDLEKVLKAGSNAKFTSLRRTEENIFDVDLGVYYSGKGAKREQLNKLLQFTRAQVRDIYRSTKQDEDFKVMNSAVRVKFRSGIKLNVDLAPIIRDDSLDIKNGGWIPRVDGWRLTSVTCHNVFIHKRTGISNKSSGPVKFNRLVRMMKWWNNRQGELAQPSIFCDLITAAAFEENGITQEWQSSLRAIFSFLRKHQFLEPIIFGDYYDISSVTVPGDPVIVLDSVNPDNNITYAWTERTRLDYLDRIQEAYDAIMDARSCEVDGDEDGAVEQWCRIFGPAFETLSQPEEENE